MATDSTGQAPGRDVRRSKLEKATAGFVERGPPLKYEFVGLDRRSTDELPKDDLHLTDPLKIDPVITDLAYVLPPPKSAIGAHWNMPIESISTLLAPGSNLLPQRDPRTEGTTNDDMWFHFLSAFIELSPDWMLVGAIGTATATLESISKSVDEPIALIRLKVHLKNSRDAAYDLGVEAKGAVPEGTQWEYKHSVELELQGEGELQWRVKDGYAQQYMLKADAEVKERVVAAIHLPPGSKHPEQGGTVSILWKGKVEATGSAEARK